MPVTWMSYALDRSLWDGDASGYHLTSLSFTLTALLVLCARTAPPAHALGAEPGGDAALWVGATVAALVFAVHPLRVEAVAWASARGTILGGLLLVLGARLRHRLGARAGGGAGVRDVVAGSLLLFAASLLARATGLVLPSCW